MVIRSPATPKVRDEVAALKRERTIDAAVDLFYEKGYENTTLDEVADRIGMTKPFIYVNFGSKSELLAEICSRGVQAARGALDAALAKPRGPAASLTAFAQRYVMAVLESQKHIAVYAREEKNLEIADARRIGEMRKAFFGKMSELLAEGADAGEFDLEDPQMAALAIGGAVTWATFWYRPDGRLSLSEITDAMTKLILGLAGAARRDTRPRRARRSRAREMTAS
jgi:AcrR family transcriptional regulator